MNISTLGNELSSRLSMDVFGLNDKLKIKFSEKYIDQYEEVKNILVNKKIYMQDTIEMNLQTFYNDLGLNEHYFETSPRIAIAHTIECVIAAKILNRISNSDYFPVIHNESETEAFWMARASLLNRKASQNYAVERELEKKYFGLGENTIAWRLQCYRSIGSVFDDPENYYERLRTYFLQKPLYSCTNVDEDEEDIDKILDLSCSHFKKGSATIEIFKSLNSQVVRDPTRQAIFVNVEPRGEAGYRLDFAYRRGEHNKEFYSRLGDCITMWGCYSQRKYVEPLLNGVSIIVCFVEELPKNLLNKPELSFEQRIHKMVKAVRMMYILPSTRLIDLAQERKLTIHEVAYAYAATKFILSFSPTVGTAFSTIEKIIKKFYDTQQISQQELYDVKTRLKAPPFSEETIVHAIYANPSLVQKLYKEFQFINHPLIEQKRKDGKLTEEIEGKHENMKKEEEKIEEKKEKKKNEEKKEKKDKLELEIISLDSSPEAPHIFKFFRIFNKAILRTNFWKEIKLAISFRFEPSFLLSVDYPEKPYGLFMSVGSCYIGYHVRFSDIARGGIRVVQSFFNQDYEKNKKDAFDETYKLANTQNFKNKDIPEGGSKGLILLNRTHTHAEAAALTKSAFKAYIDSLLDLLLSDRRIVDKLGKPEIFFLGPDEHTGTGMLMDWAALHAKRRGAWFWKAFTTGKDPDLGGIPHDMYGMTTTSVEAYIQSVFDKLNLKEEEVTKIQTGGPDGDLGSNALLRSKCKTIGIIDGSGVLYDPCGLNLEELKRLAESRFEGKPKTVVDYNKSLLSKDGFIVPQEARNIVLPDGTEIASGFEFRNEFHLSRYSKADLFNPCGGRPASINPFNVHKIINKENGKPNYKYIVEGANVFITDDARRILEKAGCILFKDASTNKGGVTSSSFEVLAALALTDEEFKEHMQVEDIKNPPIFYKNYVKAILEKVRENSILEFNALWRQGFKKNIPRADLTDILSKKIIQLKNDVLHSGFLWEDQELVESVLSDALPDVLVPKLMSVKTLIERVPADYLKAVFSSYLAARFYYTQDFLEDASACGFLNYINSLKKKNK